MNPSDVDNENDENALGLHMEVQIEASNLANMDIFSLSDPFALLESSEGEKWSEIGKLLYDSFAFIIPVRYCVC